MNITRLPRHTSTSWLNCCRYFDDDEEDKAEDLEYQPAPDSPTRDKTKHEKHEPDDDVDSDVSDDPLDAFMAEIQVLYSTYPIGPEEPVTGRITAQHI